MSVSLIATLSAPKVPDMGEEDVTVAVREVYTAQKGWAAHTAKVTIALRNVYSFTAASLCQERSGVLRRWYNLIMQNTDDLAKIVSLECVSACPAHTPRPPPRSIATLGTSGPIWGTGHTQTLKRLVARENLNSCPDQLISMQLERFKH